VVPIPKGEGKARVYHSIALEYQVAWVAIVQAIGPLLDRRMPSWSFGYRLHRPRVRFSNNEPTWLWDDHRLKSPALYLGFAQAWKPFRRYSNLTVKRMLGDESLDDPREQEVRAFEKAKAEVHQQVWHRAPQPGRRRSVDLRYFPFPYLVDGWRPRADETSRVWFARLDLQKFFPSVRTDAVYSRCLRELTGLEGFDLGLWAPVLRRWLRFHEDAGGISASGLEAFQAERVVEGGLPVGLIASGFLANVYMMAVDRDIEAGLAGLFRGHVAVLRYVDDYVIVADDRDVLCRWMAHHDTLLRKHQLRPNNDKMRPDVLQELTDHLTEHGQKRPMKWFREGGELEKLPPDPKRSGDNWLHRWRAEGSVTRLDRKEFVSTALQRMSHRADEDVDLLDENDIDARILDLADLAHAAHDHQEIRADTVEAFTAVQLQRTPIWSPAATLELKQLVRDKEELALRIKHDGPIGRSELRARLRQVTADLLRVRDGTTRRLQRRTEQVVRQIMGSFVRNPHKHRLLDRWIRASAAAAELTDTYGRRSGDTESLCALLSGRPPASDDYDWRLAEGPAVALKPSLLSFLRMRAWSALASCAEDTLRRAAFARAATGPPRGVWPSADTRLKRRLNWLRGVAKSLRTASTRDRTQLQAADVWIAGLEAQAANWWRLFERLSVQRVTRHAFSGLGRPSRKEPYRRTFVRVGLMPWATNATSRDHRAVAARHALDAFAGRVLRSRLPINDVEHRILREWVLLAPETRARLPLLSRLLAATRTSPKYALDASTVGWISDLAWALAAQQRGQRVLARLGAKAGAPYGPFFRSVLEQRTVAKDAPWTVSLRAILEREHWPQDELTGGADEPGQALQEAARVALVRGVLEHARTLFGRDDAVYLSPDNILVSSRDWAAILAATSKATAPTLPQLEYRRNLRDPLYVVPRRQQRSLDDIGVAAGLCGVAVASGLRAARRLSRVGTRSRLILASVWDAIETGPALSHALVTDVAMLCASAHLRSMNDRMREAYARQYGIPADAGTPASLLRAARVGLRALSDHLAAKATRSEDRTLYVLDAGLPAAATALGESLDVTVVQLDLDILSKRAWSFAKRTIAFNDEFVTEEAWPRLWRALRAVRASASEPQPNSNGIRPRLVVFPELAIPRRYVRTVRRLAQAHNAVVVAGVEYASESGWATNAALVAIPAAERHPAALSRAFWVGKHHPSVPEHGLLTRHDIRFQGTRDFIVFDHPTVGRLGAVICYDLYAVETLVAFQGHVLHLVIPAYNRDLTTFDGLSDAAMRLLFANVILANTGRFGGSLAVAPFYEAHDREMLRVRGQHIDTVEHLSVPLAQLELAQRQPKWDGGPRDAPEPRPRRFKTKPADWPE